MMTLADDRSFAKHPAIEVKVIHFLDEFLQTTVDICMIKNPVCSIALRISIKTCLDLKPFTRNDTESIEERDFRREKHNYRNQSGQVLNS